MASDFANVSNTVTIDRDYFETLVRRSKFNTESFQRNGGLSVATVTISQAEHDSLADICRQFDNLRRNLVRGGVEPEMLDILCRDDGAYHESTATAAAPSQADTYTEDGGASLETNTPRLQPIFAAQRHPVANNQPGAVYYDNKNNNNNNNNNIKNGNGYYQPQGDPVHRNRYSWAEAADDAEDDDGATEDGLPPVETVGANYTQQEGNRRQFDKDSIRTVLITNLAEGTTHGDITNAVRGGLLLDIFLRTNDRSAAVSFLNAADARKFYDHVRRHDMYIRNKRVEVKWGDRQFTLPHHVAGQIAKGASRNLVIRRYDGRHTAEGIREDLDHIHNLVVIDIQFMGGSCYVKLNSVHNAIYAKQCLMSRQKYKGTKIEWDVDECAQPYAPAAPKPRREVSQTIKAPNGGNRFRLLNVDGEEDEDELSSSLQNSVRISK